MKHLRKSILTLLALTLFGGAGAWAQTETLLTTVTATGQTSYSQSPDGIVTVTLNNTNDYDGTWGWLSGSVTVEASQGYTITRCVFKQNPSGNPNRMLADDLAPFTATIDGDDYHVYAATSTGEVIGGYYMDGISTIEVYGYAAAQEIELTKAGANQWTLGQTPDYDVELQVEYYEAHALKEIPAGWTVLVNGVPQTQPYQGDSLMITETDSVTLIPAGNPRRVKSVTLEEEGPAVQTITVAGLQLNYVEGETWVQTAQRNPGVITIDGSYVNKMNGSYFLKAGGSTVSPTSTYDSSLSDSYWWQEW